MLEYLTKKYKIYQLIKPKIDFDLHVSGIIDGMREAGTTSVKKIYVSKEQLDDDVFSFLPALNLTFNDYVLDLSMPANGWYIVYNNDIIFYSNGYAHEYYKQEINLQEQSCFSPPPAWLARD
jgi:hypothetical protein